MIRSMCALSLALLWGCQGEKPLQKSPVGAPASAAEATQPGSMPRPDDGAAALKLFDRAVTARLMGDEIEHQRLMVQLAAFYPATRHGRRAADRVGGGVGTSFALVGILAAIAVPAFLNYTESARAVDVMEAPAPPPTVFEPPQ